MSYKIDATQMAKICQYAINSVIFAGLVIFCYVYMMEDAIAKSNRKGNLGCEVFSFQQISDRKKVPRIC